jgi:GntR family transcriptional regulator
MDMHSDIVLSRADARPMYVQIMEQIKQRVAVGDWSPGQEIPSIRQLAVSLQVSVITVKRAYLELEREGVILTQHGKGSFVADGSGLGPGLLDQELEKLLDEAVRMAARLGLSFEGLVSRLRDAANRPTEKEEEMT